MSYLARFSYICICIYTYKYGCIWYPKDLCCFDFFQLVPCTFISSPHDRTNLSFDSHVSDHILMTAQTDHIETQCGPIFQYGPAEARIEIFWPHSVSIWRIQDPRLRGTPGKNLGARLLDPLFPHSIWPQYFNMALPESKIPSRSPVQSWILDPPY